MTPAEELTAAADRLDKLLAEATPGPWTEFGPYSIGVEQLGVEDGHMVCEMQFGADCVDSGHPDRRWADARWVAAMNPDVGRALVALLRLIAVEAKERPAAAVLFSADLDLARAILAPKETS